MTTVIDPNEKAYWLLQVNLTPYIASRAGLKYEPRDWKGTPLIRVVWVNRGGHLAEFQQWLGEGHPVSIPAVWELTVDEVIDAADSFSALGLKQTQEWMQEAHETSTLIEDAVNWEFQKQEMAMNRSTFGPHQNVQRNGFPIELRRQKLLESSRSWKT